MRGYKALNCDMSSNAGRITYEIGKEYTLGGQLEMCNNGYHFCKEIIGVFMYYRAGNCRVFEVDTLDGKVIEHDDKCCSDRIKLIREITTGEIKRYIEKNLYDLVNDVRYEYREAVAIYGYCLDKLINDDNACVRLAVVKQGYGLDKLVHDTDWHVRCEVARQGYGLDKLINDEHWYVRFTVAEQGYGLDKLINDDIWPVRQEASKQAKHSFCINPSKFGILNNKEDK